MKFTCDKFQSFCMPTYMQISTLHMTCCTTLTDVASTVCLTCLRCVFCELELSSTGSSPPASKKLKLKTETTD